MSIYDTITDALIKILELLPIDPLQEFLSNLDTIDLYLGYVNYFIPVYQWADLLSAWSIAIMGYNIYRFFRSSK